MPVFVELTTAPLDRLQAKGGAQKTARAGRSIARRPTRGIEIKEDTYATLRVIDSTGMPIPLVDSSAPHTQNTTGYTNFIIQNVSESRMEKNQIIETFGASYVFFFGEQPRFLDVSAFLLNTNDFNWEAEWWANYNTYLRGTKLVEMGARCYLAYDDSIIEGYMMMAACTKSADAPYSVALQFKFFVTNCTNVSTISSQYPIRSSVFIGESGDPINLRSRQAGQQLVDYTTQFATTQSNINAAGARAAFYRQQAALGQGANLTDLFRSMGPSVAVGASWWKEIDNLVSSDPDETDTTVNPLKIMALHEGKAIRSYIANNTDEYVGYTGHKSYVNISKPETPGGMEDAWPNIGSRNPVQTQQEADDLFMASISKLTCYGVNINNPVTMGNLGLAPYFSPGNQAGASFGAVAGAGFSASAGGGVSSYASSSVGTSAGYAAGYGVGLGAVAGGGFSTGGVTTTSYGQGTSPQSTYYNSYQTSTLGVVYGNMSSLDPRFSSKRQGFIETGTDYNYGYSSAYSPRPGFGQVGYGDFGGNGYGSANYSGDPCYLPPNKFTYAGVANEQSAWDRFQRQRYDRTALTPGMAAGTGVMAGGASVSVGGAVSAFAMVGIGGSLNIGGTNRSDPSYVSQVLAQRKFGLADPDPFGTGCTNSNGTGIGGVGAGIGFSASASVGVGVSAGGMAQAGAFAGVSAGAYAGAQAFAGASTVARAGASPIYGSSAYAAPGQLPPNSWTGRAVAGVGPGGPYSSAQSSGTGIFGQPTGDNAPYADGAPPLTSDTIFGG